MKQAILAGVLAFIPMLAFGQTPPPPAGAARLAAFLAQSLSEAMTENDALRAQIADLQKQAAKPPEPPK